MTEYLWQDAIRHEMGHVRIATALGHSVTVILEADGYQVNLDDSNVTPYDLVAFLSAGAMCEVAYDIYKLTGCDQDDLTALLVNELRLAGISLLNTRGAQLNDWEALKAVMACNPVDIIPIAKRFAPYFYEICQFTDKQLEKIQKDFDRGCRFVPDDAVIC